MAHQIYGRHLGRTKDARRALFRNLVGQLIARGRVKTTIAKAKAIKPFIDKLVTKAKRASLASRREIVASLPKEAGLRLVDTIVPQFKNRTSGFSRIVRLGERRGDNAELVLLEWTEKIVAVVPVEPRSNKKLAATDDAKKETKTAKVGSKRVKKR